MNVSLTPLDPAGADRDALVEFLAENTFPFHVRPRATREQVGEAIDRSEYDDDETKTFWLQRNDGTRVGIVRLEDLEDATPLFDLRLGETHRGHGFGFYALRAITQYVFTKWPGATHFEGQTREDNIPMRRIFLRQGWLKEAHYRESWPIEGGEPVASVAYAILRRDWELREVTASSGRMSPWNRLLPVDSISPGLHRARSSWAEASCSSRGAEVFCSPPAAGSRVSWPRSAS